MRGSLPSLLTVSERRKAVLVAIPAHSGPSPVSAVSAYGPAGTVTGGLAAAGADRHRLRYRDEGSLHVTNADRAARADGTATVDGPAPGRPDRPRDG